MWKSTGVWNPELFNWYKIKKQHFKNISVQEKYTLSLALVPSVIQYSCKIIFLYEGNLALHWRNITATQNNLQMNQILKTMTI